MTTEIDPSVDSFLHRLLPSAGLKAPIALRNCKLCGANITDLRDHLHQAHQMSAAAYRALGTEYSLLPASYGARKAAYLSKLDLAG